MIKRGIYRISMESTRNCNLQCEYCCAPKLVDKTELDEDELVTMVKDFKKNGSKVISISGGEPMIKPKLLSKLSIMDTVLFSNLTLFNKEKFDEYFKNFKGDLRISIDNIPDFKERFRKGTNNSLLISKNIKQIRKDYPHIQIIINTILNNDNIDRLLKFYEFVKKLDVHSWDMVFPQVRGKLNTEFFRNLPSYEKVAIKFSELLNYYVEDETKNCRVNCMYLFRYHDLIRKKWKKIRKDEHPCAHMSNNIFINLYGEIIICPWYESLVLGNIRNIDVESFLETINQHPSAKWKQSDFKECNNCRYRFFCLTCPGESHSIQGNVEQASYHKCSFRYYWEKHVLPVYPDFIKKKYENLIDQKGEYPKYFTHISKIPQKTQN